MSSTRLNGVLRVRKLQERRARGEVAVQRRHHRHAVDVEHRTWEQLDELAMVGVPYGLRARCAVATAGMFAAETQHRTTENAAAAVEVATGHWTVAARRVEALDRLAERHAALEREEQARLQANEIDDLVLARFGREPGANNNTNSNTNSRGGR